MHQRDTARLIHTLKEMRDLGNTVLVVEHDDETIRAADWIVDLGPGAGEHGGEVVVEGPLDAILAHPDVAHRRVSLRAQVRPAARAAPPGQRQGAGGSRRAPAQPQEHRRALPAGAVHVRHRCLGVGQEQPGRGDALQAPGAGAQPARGIPPGLRCDRWRRVHRQGHQHRPVTHRAHAALQSGDLHRRRSIPSVRSSRSCRNRRFAATSRGASRSTSRAGAARRARDRGRCASRCSFCRRSTCRATSAMGRATIARRSRCATRTRTSPRCWR